MRQVISFSHLEKKTITNLFILQPMTTNKWVMTRRSKKKPDPIHSLKKPSNISHRYVEISITEWRNLEEASGGWSGWSVPIQRLRRDADSRSLPPTAGRGTSAERAWNATRFPQPASSSTQGRGEILRIIIFFYQSKYSNGTCSATRHQHRKGSAGAYLIGCLQEESLGAYGSR